MSYHIKALKDVVLATDADFGDHVTASGIIIKATTGTNSGIVPRWFKVFEVGPEVPADIQPGSWVLVEHGRWSDGLDTEDPRQGAGSRVWRIDPLGILGVSDEQPDFGVAYNQNTAWS
jgi:hypothetical protein